MILESAFRVHNDSICRLQYFPDGEMLLTSTNEMDTDAELDEDDDESDEVGVIKIWGPDHGVQHSYRKYDHVTFPELSDDGRLIAWGAYQGRFCFLSAKEGLPIKKIRVMDTWDRPGCVKFIPKSNDLIYRLGNAWWRLNIKTGSYVVDKTIPFDGIFTFSSDGKRIAVVEHGNPVTAVPDSIHIWDRQNDRSLVKIPGHSDCTRQLLFHTTLPLLATCGMSDSGFKVWNFSDISKPRLVHSQTGDCFDFVFLHDMRLVTGHMNGNICLWDLATGQAIDASSHVEPSDLRMVEEEDQIIITNERPSITAVAVSPDGRKIAVGTANGTVLFYDVTPTVTV